jgi:hypothetical protein
MVKIMSNSKFLINIPNEDRENGRTKDSIRYQKDCDDFQCLEDGTIVRECRYCNLSLMCRQIDILPNGKAMPMEGHVLPIVDETGGVMEHQIFCTGMYDLRSLNERKEDDKVS